MKIETNEERMARLTECCAFIALNPAARYPRGWVAEVESEARTVGLMKPLVARIGCNVPKEPYFEPVYGGDMEDVF